MQKILIFDVDGTLTGPRRVINEDFARFFRYIAKSETVFLVSGSDMPKLEEQVPQWLIGSVAGVFPCSGNEMFEAGMRTFSMNHTFPGELIEFVNSLVENSAYGERTGKHVEYRTGSLNVSVVGRNANPAQREAYTKFDLETGERRAMVDTIQEAFPDYEANRGGQISIDVSPKGWNKSRVYTKLAGRFPEAAFYFFGDNIDDGGNDLPLAEAISNGSEHNCVYSVRDHFETWKILQEDFTPDYRRTG